MYNLGIYYVRKGKIHGALPQGALHFARILACLDSSQTVPPPPLGSNLLLRRTLRCYRLNLNTSIITH